jgi:hypothetical protein
MTKTQQAIEAARALESFDETLSGNEFAHMNWVQEHENAIRQALEQTQWQPIETAPKDGTPVLTSDGGFMCYVAYLKDDNWIIFSDDDGDRYWFPTIWTPFNLPNGCKHNWVSARNKVVTSGEMCTKCFALRPEPPQPEKND